MNRTSLAVGTVFILLILAGGWYFFAGQHKGAVKDFDLSFATSTQENTGAPAQLPQDAKQYTNSMYGFSLYYPEALRVREYDEGGGARSIIFEQKGGGGGFQVYVQPYKEDYITEDRFRLDEPSGVLEQKTDIVVGGVPAVMFFSKNALLGQTREVWFIKSGYLFEVVTYKELDQWLSEIMSTWQFLPQIQQG